MTDQSDPEAEFMRMAAEALRDTSHEPLPFVGLDDEGRGVYGTEGTGMWHIPIFDQLRTEE